MPAKLHNKVTKNNIILLKLRMFENDEYSKLVESTHNYHGNYSNCNTFILNRRYSN